MYKPTVHLIIRGMLAGSVFAAAAVFAWAGPSAAAPNGNASAPLNIGASDQVKNANLAVNGLSVFGNSLLNPGAYLNWGTTAGSGGYGMRDAGGILEFKTATGTWQSIQAIITSVTASSSSSWSSGPSGSIYYSAGNVGIGTSAAPPAVLSVAGAMRLSPLTSAPVTCNASYIGAIAVSDSTSHLCVCNGTAWVFDYNGAACLWDTGGVTPGSQSYTTAGTYSFTVPAYNTLTVEVWGGGGGGEHCYMQATGVRTVTYTRYCWGGNTAGAASSFNGVVANGGGTGDGAAGGSATGGDVNLPGENSTYCGGSVYQYCGGGGSGLDPVATRHGVAPGGGADGYAQAALTYGGGGGGYAKKTWSSGVLTEGANYTVIVGSGGPNANGNGAAPGAPGRVVITWD